MKTELEKVLAELARLRLTNTRLDQKNAHLRQRNVWLQTKLHLKVVTIARDFSKEQAARFIKTGKVKFAKN